MEQNLFKSIQAGKHSVVNTVLHCGCPQTSACNMQHATDAAFNCYISIVCQANSAMSSSLQLKKVLVDFSNHFILQMMHKSLKNKALQIRVALASPVTTGITLFLTLYWDSMMSSA